MRAAHARLLQAQWAAIVAADPAAAPSHAAAYALLLLKAVSPLPHVVQVRRAWAEVHQEAVHSAVAAAALPAVRSVVAAILPEAVHSAAAAAVQAVHSAVVTTPLAVAVHSAAVAVAVHSAEVATAAVAVAAHSAEAATEAEAMVVVADKPLRKDFLFNRQIYKDIGLVFR